eukprot:m.339648 g.339648  ORF g.339648 m.339648 type:complete len:314 (+) comp18896_c0_seq1:77-1018(+)
MSLSKKTSMQPDTVLALVKQKVATYKSQNRISHLQLFVNGCIEQARRSPDPSTKVGCVLINGERVQVGAGYNAEIRGGKPRSAVPKDLVSLAELPRQENWNVEDLPPAPSSATNTDAAVAESPKGGRNKRQKMMKNVKRLSGNGYVIDVCFNSKQKPSHGGDTAIHAEMNAVVFSTSPRLRDEKQPLIAFVSLMPCPQCYKLLAQLQVQYVIVLSDSGRYLDTLKLMTSIREAPKILFLHHLLSKIENLSWGDFNTNPKVFKQIDELATFVGEPKDKIIELKEEDFTYEAIYMEPPPETVENVLQVLFLNERQ